MNNDDVRVLVLSGYGLNCDNETAFSFELAGAKSCRVHINSLIDGSEDLENFHILVFGGGFSWGDDHGAGVVQSVRMRTHIGDKILKFIDDGKLIIGICNGFQTLVNMGLLPGLENDYTKRTVALTYNDCGNFRDQWVKLKINDSSPCVFTQNINFAEFPVRHGEGKFYADDAILKKLIDNNQIVMRYATDEKMFANGRFPENPNGSIEDIAGICDLTGRVFGLMPHPEAFNHYTNHPDWTRNREMAKRNGDAGQASVTKGIQIFKNAVDFIERRF